MRKVLATIALTASLFVLVGLPAEACGDKLMMLGRGIRFQSGYAPRPASILLYVPAGSPGASALMDPNFQSALTEAGHKLRTAGSRKELLEALKSGEPDLVISDLDYGREVDQAAQDAGNNPIFLPVLPKEEKAQAAGAKKQYGVVLVAPGRAGYYCATVDKALELKSKPRRGSH